MAKAHLARVFWARSLSLSRSRVVPRWAGGEGEGSIARETFVNSLAKFTLLDTVKEMRPKSIDCVRALLDIALEDGDFLAESWGSVLRHISQLARLQASFVFCLSFVRGVCTASVSLAMLPKPRWPGPRRP